MMLLLLAGYLVLALANDEIGVTMINEEGDERNTIEDPPPLSNQWRDLTTDPDANILVLSTLRSFNELKSASAQLLRVFQILSLPYSPTSHVIYMDVEVAFGSVSAPPVRDEHEEEDVNNNDVNDHSLHNPPPPHHHHHHHYHHHLWQHHIRTTCLRWEVVLNDNTGVYQLIKIHDLPSPDPFSPIDPNDESMQRLALEVVAIIEKLEDEEIKLIQVESAEVQILGGLTYRFLLQVQIGEDDMHLNALAWDHFGQTDILHYEITD